MKKNEDLTPQPCFHRGCPARSDSWDPEAIPSGYVKIVIENDPLIVDLHIENCDFP